MYSRSTYYLVSVLCVCAKNYVPQVEVKYENVLPEKTPQRRQKSGKLFETFPKVSQWMYGEFAFCLLCCLHVYSPSLSFPLAVFPTKGKKKEKAKRNNLINFVCVGGRHKNCRLDPGTGLKILPNTQTRTHMTG